MNCRYAARKLIVGVAMLLLVACAHDNGIDAAAAAPDAGAKPAQTATPAETPRPITCTEPRSQVCTRDYRPVCATRDTGIRCITAPCPSSEQRTYSNGCEACSDPKVLQHVEGACP
jgi:hypothetical protein